jgi:hypothetical protein
VRFFAAPPHLATTLIIFNDIQQNNALNVTLSIRLSVVMLGVSINSFVLNVVILSIMAPFLLYAEVGLLNI